MGGHEYKPHSSAAACSNHSLNHNIKSNFTWMPRHKFFISTENKSFVIFSLSSFPPSPPETFSQALLLLSLLRSSCSSTPLILPDVHLIFLGKWLACYPCEIDLMNFSTRFIAAIRPVKWECRPITGKKSYLSCICSHTLEPLFEQNRFQEIWEM